MSLPFLALTLVIQVEPFGNLTGGGDATWLLQLFPYLHLGDRLRMSGWDYMVPSFRHANHHVNIRM